MNLLEIEERWEKGYDLYSDKDMEQFHKDVTWLISRAKKSDMYEDLALDHNYQTILDEIDE